MSKLVRMSDIAQRLHISTVTVSKALSGKDGVSDALRLKIQQTAEQMGYQRKTIQAERSNRFTVAVLIERFMSIEKIRSAGRFMKGCSQHWKSVDIPENWKMFLLLM